jgi:peroxiredoxin
MARFRRRGVRILGVSPDKPEKNARFREGQGFPYTLLSDTEHVLTKAYGAWKKKRNYGREYMGLERSTFLVDGRGVVRRAWRAVKVDGHVAAVLDAAKDL